MKWSHHTRINAPRPDTVDDGQVIARRRAAPGMALTACERMLRPVVRLALVMGLRHAELRELGAHLWWKKGSARGGPAASNPTRASCR